MYPFPYCYQVLAPNIRGLAGGLYVQNVCGRVLVQS